MRVCFIGIKNLGCERFADEIRNKLWNSEGIISVWVYTPDKEVKCIYDSRYITAEKIGETLKEMGFHIDYIKDGQ